MAVTSVGGRLTRTCAVLLLLALSLVVALTGRAYASEGRIAYIADPAVESLRKPVDLNGNKIATMWSDGTHVHTLVSVDPSQTIVGAPTWSYNGLWIAYTANPNENPSSTTPSQIRVVRWDGARDHTIAFHPPWPGWTPTNAKVMAWSPSGRYLIVAENRAARTRAHGDRDWLVVIDLRSGVARPFLRAGNPQYRFSSLSFTPDGRHLAVGEVAWDYADSPARLQPVLNRLVDVSTARTVFTYPSDVYGIDMAPDGKHLSFLESTLVPYLRRADMNFHGRTTLIKLGAGEVNGDDYLGYTKWSQDGARVAVTALHVERRNEAYYFVPYVAHVRSNGSGLTTPLTGTGSWAGAFDW